MRSFLKWMEELLTSWAKARAATELARQGRHEDAKRLMAGD